MHFKRNSHRLRPKTDLQALTRSLQLMQSLCVGYAVIACVQDQEGPGVISLPETGAYGSLCCAGDGQDRQDICKFVIVRTGAAQCLVMLNQALVMLPQEFQWLWYRGHGGGGFPDFFANAIQSYTLQQACSLEFCTLKASARPTLHAEADSPVFLHQSPWPAPQTAPDGS